MRFDFSDLDPGIVDDTQFLHPSFSDTGSSFDGAFGLIGFLVVVGIVVSIVMAVRRAHKLHQAGIDVLDPETDMQVRMARSRAMAPAEPAGSAAASSAATRSGTVADRLAEADRLLAAGTISAAEHATARARILGTL